MVSKKQNRAMTWHLIKILFYQYATFTGRARRGEYWLFVLSMIVIATTIGMFIDLLYYGVDDMHSYHVTGQFHDNGTGRFKAHWDIHLGWGWVQLLYLIPVLGWLLMILFLVTEGNDGRNQYGEDPLKTDEQLNI